MKPGYGGTGAGGGSRSYAGGAATPYAAGGRSPRGIAPFLLPLAALSIFPGIWLASAYAYNFDQPYHFVNRTQKSQDQPDGTNQTLPVSCLCQQYQVCGCDQNDDQSYLDGIVGDGNVGNFDKSVVALSNVNNTQTLVLNGTLPNGTTADGGTDNPSADPTTDSTGAALSALVITASGWWLMVGTVILTVFFL